MQRYTSYRSALDELLIKACWGRENIALSEIHPHLNGGAAASLRELVSRAQIRRSGAFFTGEDLGRRVIEIYSSDVSHDLGAWDPTCGAGDLLLRWSERLPVSRDLAETLDNWGECLHGKDIHQEFIAVAKRRLVLAAISRGASLKRGRIADIDKLFPHLHCGSTLKKKIAIPKSTVVLMNPPFTMITTPEDCRPWASGKVSFAAVAMLRCLTAAASGQKLSAILPDVLRSGSRYAAWRREIESHVRCASIELEGRFSANADVDVFVLHATAGASATRDAFWLHPSGTNPDRTLDSICHIQVGAVVPHRHVPAGRKVSYLTTLVARPWLELKRFRSKIQFAGSLVSGPFLAVRRTSSPSDLSRPIATLINSKQKVAVENHLIVIRPYDNSVETCRKIMFFLQSTEVRRWLDQRIRCRHLTVSSLKQLPLSDNL